jgi:transcriptional regulator with XRE-family HTH domain
MVLNMTAEDDIINKRIGRRVRMVRQIRGFKLKDIGEALNMTWQQVQKYEVGKNKIPLNKLMMLSKILNVPMNTFTEEKVMCDLE